MQKYSDPVEGAVADLYPLSGQGKALSGVHSFLAMSVRLVSLELSTLAGIDSIGDDFLAGCRSLRDLDLSGLQTVTTIGSGFLRDCDQLESLDLNPLADVTSVGVAFLMNAKKLAEVDVRPLKSCKWSLEQWLDGTSNIHVLRIGPSGTPVSEIKKAIDRATAAKKRKELCTIGRNDRTKPLKVKVDAYEPLASDLAAAADWAKLFALLECTEEVDPSKASKWVRGVECTKDSFQRDKGAILACGKEVKVEEGQRRVLEGAEGLLWEGLLLEHDETLQRLDIKASEPPLAVGIALATVTDLERAERALYSSCAVVDGSVLLLCNDEGRVRIDEAVNAASAALTIALNTVSELEYTERSHFSTSAVVGGSVLLLCTDEGRMRIDETADAANGALTIATATLDGIESTARKQLDAVVAADIAILQAEESEPRERHGIVGEEGATSATTLSVLSMAASELLWRLAADGNELQWRAQLLQQHAADRTFVEAWSMDGRRVAQEEALASSMATVLWSRLAALNATVAEEALAWQAFLAERVAHLTQVHSIERQNHFRRFFAEMVGLSHMVVAEEHRDAFRTAVTQALP